MAGVLVVLVEVELAAAATGFDGGEGEVRGAGPLHDGLGDIEDALAEDHGLDEGVFGKVAELAEFVGGAGGLAHAVSGKVVEGEDLVDFLADGLGHGGGEEARDDQIAFFVIELDFLIGDFDIGGGVGNGLGGGGHGEPWRKIKEIGVSLCGGKGGVSMDWVSGFLHFLIGERREGGLERFGVGLVPRSARSKDFYRLAGMEAGTCKSI